MLGLGMALIWPVGLTVSSAVILTVQFALSRGVDKSEMTGHIRLRGLGHSFRVAGRSPLHASREVGSRARLKGSTMSALYSGLPAASSVQESIILAQLELLRRLDPARIEATKALLLRD
jgi:hypothetical protein